MLFTLYAVFCVFLPCLVYQLILYRHQSFRQDKQVFHLIEVFVFLLYVYLALSVAGIGSIWDLAYYDLPIRWEEVNLQPFYSGGVMTYLLNVIMFLPLGFLVPLIWKDYRKPWLVTGLGLGFSLAIECCQLFNLRMTDVDDLLMNTLGALLGYGIWVLTRSWLKPINQASLSLAKKEPIAYLLLAVLGHFLLFNWRILL